MELNNETNWTDGEPVVTNPNDGMIRLLTDIETTTATLQRINEEMLVDLGRLQMLNLVAGREIELIDEAKRRQQCQTTES